MKMLLLGSAGSPYLASLVAALQPHGFEVDLIDPYQGWFRAAGDVDKIFYHGNGLDSIGLNQWQRARGLRKFLSGRHYDVCNVHYNSAFYGLIPNALRAVADRLVVSIWGSDLHAGSTLLRILQGRLLRRADAKTINNPDRKPMLEKLFGLPDSEVHVAFMPLSTLSAIEEKIADGVTRSSARERLGFSATRPLVLCGTNARPEQRHEEILDSLERESVGQNASGGDLAKANYVLPLTYGAESNAYIDSVIERAARSPLKVRCLTTFLSEEEMILLRLAVDGVIQVQRHDMFSAVMQEALYAGSWVVTGAWLPYQFLRPDVPSLHVVSEIDEVGGQVADLLAKGPTVSDRERGKIRDIAGLEESGKVWAKILRGE